MEPIIKAIQDRHTHKGVIDEEQLKAIFSSNSHIIVEAPAGYGKTKTMVSKIAYLIASEKLLYPKKILALTFSINAAFKIRKDVSEQLPSILNSTQTLVQNVAKVVYATNYHGFSRRILNRFGYLTHPNLSEIDSLTGIGFRIDDDYEKTKGKLQDDLNTWNIVLTDKEIDTLIHYTKSIYSAGQTATQLSSVKFLLQNTEEYLQIIREKFLPQKIVTFDSILLLARQIFRNNSQILEFYRDFFPIIIVDEFQDTNILQWSLLQDMVGRGEERKNQLYLFGDRYQKIYDFIGAMEEIVDKAKSQYSMNEIQLLKNYRFSNNQALLQFDANIRKIAQRPHSPNIKTDTPITVLIANSQDDEAGQIISQIKSLLARDSKCTIAILTRQGKSNQNTLKIVQHLNIQKEQGFSYFYALYSDEDEEYVEFHKRCLHGLYSNLNNYSSFKNLCRRVINYVNQSNISETQTSLQTLLKTFFTQVTNDFGFLSTEEKIELVIDTLRNKALKQYLMYVTDANVTLSTIHGSKGLEWDHVILPDMEKYMFPPSALCWKTCHFSKNCQINWEKLNPDDRFITQFTQELNVFYVGGTRAKKSVSFSYSTEGLDFSGKPRKNNMSCLLKLEGMIIDYNKP